MHINTYLRIALKTCVLIVLSTGSSLAGTLDKVQFIKIAPQDAKAVIKAADGKLQVIKPGDDIGENVTVKEIAANRIVLEEKTDNGPETVIVRMESGKARIERLKKQPDKGQPMVAPATMPAQK
ncbi:hypothetical protein [Geotalea toluenoxydans]|uniref:hypothetical protein n=1 Tax=Geotalea toluenoxydans TaxID=421624 RepID=UPI0006CFA81B|nr:hypothetical protein [Geotalea toluenoxydans]